MMFLSHLCFYFSGEETQFIRHKQGKVNIKQGNLWSSVDGSGEVIPWCFLGVFLRLGKYATTG